MIRQAVLPLLCLLPGLAFAEPTRELSISGPKEVLEGDPESTSVDALGAITPGPVSAVLYGGAEHPVLSLLPGPDGKVYYGTAAGGLWVLPAKGAPQNLAAADGRLFAALARSGNTLYAGISPDAEIVSFEGTTQKPFAKLTAKYVWALVPQGGALVAATGEPGQVLKINGGGKTEVLFDPGETHIRALLQHPKRGLIAGGGQRGIVYQVGPKGSYALYDSEYEEVTSLAVDEATGDLYAAFVSETKSGEILTDRYIGSTKGDVDEDGLPFKGSEVVRIKMDGQIEVLWSSKSEGALALAFQDQQLYFSTGTGPKRRGRIYTVERSARDRLVLHARLEAALVPALIPAPGGGSLLAGTAPRGQLIRIGPGARAESVYLSSEQDLIRLSAVGRLWFDADLPPGAQIEVSARAGNTKTQDATWSGWSSTVGDPQGGNISLPRARYLQIKAVLRSAPKGAAPKLKSLHASVVRANIPPRVQEVFLLRRGVYMASLPPEEDKEKTVTLSRNIFKELRGPEPVDDQRLRVRQGIRPGMLTVAFTADDPNRDELLYKVERRRLGEDWSELATDLSDPYYSFDSRAQPDGRYQIRVTASDRPSNPPDQTLSDAAESDPFLIDNTSPRLAGLKATAQGGRWLLEATVEDELSVIAVAEVSVDGGAWLMMPAKDGLLDATKESLALVITPKSKPKTILLRVEDDAGNVSTGAFR